MDGIIDRFVEDLDRQIKQGLHREYVPAHLDLPVMHGSIDVEGTIRNRLERRYLISCDSEVLSVNNMYNRLLKAVILRLIRDPEVHDDVRARLKKAIIVFSDVEETDSRKIDWEGLKRGRLGKKQKQMTEICRSILGVQQG